MLTKMSKKLISIIMILTLIVALSSCATEDAKQESKENTTKATETTKAKETTAKSETEKKEAEPEGAEIAIILKTLANPFWVAMKEGIEAQAADLGIKVDIYAAQSEDDLQGQLNLLETAISKGYKAIGIAPLSPVNLNSAIADATKKGIYVVNIDEKVDLEQLKGIDGTVIGFVTTDNVAVGKKGAGFIVENLADGGQVAIVEGKAGNASGEDRKNGAKAAFEEAGNFEIVESQPADWDRAKALDVATNIIAKYPDLKGFYCCNDTMALGVLQAVMNANKLGEILVVGTDGTPEAIESIKAGDLSATVAQDPAQVGAMSLVLLNDALKAGAKIDVSAEVERTAVDSKLITK